MKNKNPALVIAVALILSGGIIGYGFYASTQAPTVKEGTLICINGVCKKTVEYSAAVTGKLCQNNLELQKNAGIPQGIHTKNEANKVYFSGEVSVEQSTGKIIDTAPFTIQNLVSSLGIEIPESCTCLGKSELRVTINGEARPEKLDAVWQNGDFIVIEYR